MIFAKQIRVVDKNGSVKVHIYVTQLYTIGNHVVIVSEEDKNSYTTDRYTVAELDRMEVQF